jgi:intermembrane space import and assembly protein 40
LPSTSKSSIHSNPPSSTDSDSDTISGDAKKEDDIDGEGVDGEGSSGEGAPASGGAFNPETGEINWDCPCLGGMAHGPCGPQFREAFSCFVYSEAEPKGINCVEKFQNMQNCFREHPEIYADGGIILFFV